MQLFRIFHLKPGGFWKLAVRIWVFESCSDSSETFRVLQNVSGQLEELTFTQIILNKKEHQDLQSNLSTKRFTNRNGQRPEKFWFDCSKMFDTGEMLYC